MEESKQFFNNSTLFHAKPLGHTTLTFFKLIVSFHVSLDSASEKNNGGNEQEECACLTRLHLIFATSLLVRNFPNFIDIKDFNLSNLSQLLGGRASI